MEEWKQRESEELARVEKREEERRMEEKMRYEIRKRIRIEEEEERVNFMCKKRFYSNF